jgi:hypothetical protein
MKEPYELQSYQQALRDKMLAGGFRQGELKLVAAGRQSGKSILNEMYNRFVSQMPIPQPKFEILAQAQVDDATWYTVACTKEVGSWLEKQPKELQYAHTNLQWFSNNVDIHEKLYTLMALRWS